MAREFFLLIGCVVLSYSLAHTYRVAAKALQIVDRPNHRSAHELVTPTGAGITFVTVFCLGLAMILQVEPRTPSNQLFLDILVPLLLVTLIGFIDDFRPLPWWVRAVVHVGSASWIVTIVDSRC